MDKKNNMSEEKRRRFSKEALEAMLEAIEIGSGKIKTKAYHSAAEMFADLDAENGQPKFNKETEDAIREARDIIAGKIHRKAYNSVEEFVTDMEAMEDEEK